MKVELTKHFLEICTVQEICNNCIHFGRNNVKISSYHVIPTACIIILILLLTHALVAVFQSNELGLRIKEKDGLYIVQRSFRFGLISIWDDKKRFRSKESAEKYINELYENDRQCKEIQIED